MAKRKKRREARRSDAQSVAALRRNGLEAFASGDYERAVDAWERAGARQADQRPTAALAEAYFRLGLKREGAAGYEDFQRAVALQPDAVRYRYHLGLSAHRKGDLEAAIAAYRVVRQHDGEFAQRAAYPLALALHRRGEGVADAGVWDELTPAQQEALGLAGAFRRRPFTVPGGAAPLWQGLAACDEGDYEAAGAHLNRALEETPGAKGIAHTYLGVIAAQAERWQEAAHHWSQALAAGFESPRLHDNLGEVYHRLAEERLSAGDVDGALAAATEAERFKADDNQLNQLLAHLHHRRAYEAAGREAWAAALDGWEMAESQEGGSFRVAYNLALAHEKEEEYVAAAERWREALRRKPRRDDHPDAMSDEQVARLWQRAAEAYVLAGDYEEAARVYNLAVKWQPDNLAIRRARAESLLDDGRFQAAENELARILKGDPDYIPALLLLGDVEAEGGRGWFAVERAAARWERVLELDPGNEEARQRLADLFLNQADEARRWGFYSLDDLVETYERALAYRPHDGRIEAQIAQTLLSAGYLDEAEPYIESALHHNPADAQVYTDIIIGWFMADEPDAAWELMERAEAAVPDLTPLFYLNVASNCLYNEREDLARPWLERAIAKAPPEAPMYLIIGEMTITMPGAEEVGMEYVSRAIEAGQEPGQAHLIMGILAAKMDDDEAAKAHWQKAERIARKSDDDALLQRIKEARDLFSGPFAAFRQIFGDLDPFAGDLPFPDELFELDDEFFDDDFFEDDDEFYF